MTNPPDDRSSARGNDTVIPELTAQKLPPGCPSVVAVVTDALYPYFMGGKEVLYHHVTTRLAERGIEVHVYTMHWWEGAVNRAQGNIQLHALSRVYDLYHKGRRSILEAVMFALACFRLLTRHFDLIYADHMPHLQLFTLRIISKIRRVPLIVTWHEVWGREYWCTYLGRLGTVAAAVEHVAMRLADHVVTVSDETAHQLSDSGIPINNITVIPNGVDLAAIASAVPSPEHYDFLYVGRLLEHKRVRQLIEGVAALRAEGMKVSCAIVGEGPELANLVQLQSQLELDDCVTFLSNLPEQTDVFSLMKAATALVLPSIREGFGIVVAEAIACGLPVITTNHPENRAQQLVEDGVNGWLCPPTSEGVTAALREAATGGAIHRIPSDELRRRFDWDLVATELINVFSECSLRFK